MSAPIQSGSLARSFWLGSLVLSVVFATALFSSWHLGAGWWWDVAGGVGFAALALFGFLNLATGQGARLGSHRSLGWWVLGLTTAHAAFYLATDSVVVNHLKLTAPPGMLVGIAALLIAIVGALVSLSRWRLRAHGTRETFRRSHRWMSWVVLAGAIYHVVAIAHSVHQLGQVVLLAVGGCFLLLVSERVARRMEYQVPIAGLLVISGLGVLCFVLVRNV